MEEEHVASGRRPKTRKRRGRRRGTKKSGRPERHAAVRVGPQFLVKHDRDVLGPDSPAIDRARVGRVAVSGDEEDRPACFAQQFRYKVRRFTSDGLLVEEVATAGDEVATGCGGALDDPGQRLAQVLTAAERSRTGEAFASERSVQVEVSEVQEAKGQRSLVELRVCPYGAR